MSSNPLPTWATFGTASLGGVMGWCVVHPFYLLSVRMSLASTTGQKFDLGATLKRDGVMSLYDGLSAGCLRQVVYAGSRFGLYEMFRDKMHEVRGKTDFASRVVTGATAGGIAAYLSCPMEVCVVRISNDRTLPEAERRGYNGVFDAGMRIVKEEGAAAFWRGSAPFVQRAMMVGCFQVATYDEFKGLYARQLNQKKNSIPNVFCAAMTSGLIYSLATMPLESAKNRMAGQKPGPDGKLPYTGTVQTLAKVAKEEGILGLYKGYAPYYLRCGGHTVCMFIFVQMLRDSFVKMQGK